LFNHPKFDLIMNDVLLKLFRKLSLCIIAMAIAGIAWAQQKSVSGTVTDQSGDPLPGVTVLLKGTSYWYSNRYQWKF
jgi:TonB-dependent starch-binding outer membrane protein SusC